MLLANKGLCFTFGEFQYEFHRMFKQKPNDPISNLTDILMK